MKRRLWKIIIVSLAVVAAITCAALFFPETQDMRAKVEGNNMFSLLKPRLVSAEGAGTTFLDEEAGMSIYTDTGQSLDLSVARTKYRTIEEETADYIVGSVALPDLPENDDVHIFVHKDGWIVVYYLSEEPVSKIIDWAYCPGSLTNTKLQVGLEEMCYHLGVTTSGMSYYHFHYPYANKWMAIVECASSSAPDIFNLKIPGGFTVYERSYSNYAYGCTSYLRVDGSTVSTTLGKTEYGELSASQLSLDVFHAIAVDPYNFYSGDKACAAIVLVYLEP